MPITKGLFISVEGGEGVGKTTFCRMLRHKLEKLGCEVLATHEPGGTQIGKKVREWFLSPPGDEPLMPLTELFLVSAARAQHVAGPIREFLRHDKAIVLCDRFHDSSRVYQGILGGNPKETLEMIIATSVSGIEPQLTFLLDCDAHAAMRRVGARGGQAELNRFDGGSLAFYEKLRSAYRSVAEQFPDRIVVLDAAQSEVDVVEQAWAELIHRKLLPAD